MNKNKFLKRLFKTGEVTNDELLAYCLKYYFSKGYTITDLEDDLILKYNMSEFYAAALIRDIKEIIKKL